MAPGYSTADISVLGQPSVSSAGSGGFDSLLTASLGNTLGGISNIYGSQNAAEAQNHGILAGIGTQQQTMGNINSLFSGQKAAGENAFSQLGTTNPFATQQAAGNNAFKQLGNLQGLNGAAPDYSGFENSPGFQFALQQGQNAIRSQAAANGSAYTPNTLANIGKFVTGTASQNYNNYVDQLLQTAGLGAQGNTGQLNQMLGTAGLGAQANSTLSGANLTTGGNISQLQQNSGNAMASGSAAGAGAWGSLANSLLGGVNGSGVLGAIGSGIRGIGNLFGGGNGSVGGIGGFGDYSGYSSDPNAGNYIGNVGNVDGSSIVDQYGNSNPTLGSDVVDRNSLTNPYGNLDFSGGYTGDFGNP